MVVINGTTGINTIQDNTITSAKIVDGSIVTSDMATSATSIGVGQTWQDVTASRALGVTYTNTTGKPIYVVARLDSVAGNAQFNFAINGSIISSYAIGTNYSNIMHFIVPNGHTYAINLQANTGTLGKWTELR